ncbi:MAG: hypothetical protein ABSF26_09625 [Thermoguttaceae bacterium]
MNTDDLWVDDIPPVGPIRCRIVCAKRPERVTVEPEGQTVESSWKDGVLEVVVPRLEIHTCLAVCSWQRPGR